MERRLVAHCESCAHDIETIVLVIRVSCCSILGEKNYTIALCIFSLIIMKSLQLRGRRKIAEPRKYCLVLVIIFFGVCFLYFFCFSQVRNFWLNSLHLFLSINMVLLHYIQYFFDNIFLLILFLFI